MLFYRITQGFIYTFFIAASVQSETLILEHNSLQILHMPHKTNTG